MDRLAIEFICTFGMPPVEYVELAAELGVSRVGFAPAPITANPHGYQAWDLRTNRQLLRDTKRALEANSVEVALGEGFLITPDTEMGDAKTALDLMAELGAPRVNAVSIEEDRSRAVEQFARLAELAAARGLHATLEFLPLRWPATLTEALDLVAETGAANGQVLIDAMHFFRSGTAIADLDEVAAGRIGHIQICDVPMPAQTDDYGEEARHERLCPGEGDLPLADLLRALPRDLTVGLEVPMLAKAQDGIGPRERLAPCVAAARKLLADVDQM